MISRGRPNHIGVTLLEIFTLTLTLSLSLKGEGIIELRKSYHIHPIIK